MNNKYIFYVAGKLNLSVFFIKDYKRELLYYVYANGGQINYISINEWLKNTKLPEHSLKILLTDLTNRYGNEYYLLQDRESWSLWLYRNDYNKIKKEFINIPTRFKLSPEGEKYVHESKEKQIAKLPIVISVGALLVSVIFGTLNFWANYSLKEKVMPRIDSLEVSRTNLISKQYNLHDYNSFLKKRQDSILSLITKKTAIEKSANAKPHGK